MIENHKGMWEDANKGNPPYLLFNPDPTAPMRKPERQMPAAPPSAMWQEAAIANDDMKSTTGIYDASLGAQGNETSGRAIIARQREGDTGNFVYIDNLALAIERCGEILVELIPKIYDTERVVRILGEDDVEDYVRLNVPFATENGAEYVTVLRDKHGNDIYKPPLDAGKYDVRVDTGPSYSTKRVEAADSLIAFAQAVPAAAGIISDLIAKNMDWPGADEIAERLRKTLPPGLADDEEEMTEEQMMMRQQAAAQAQMSQQIALAQAQAEIEK